MKNAKLPYALIAALLLLVLVGAKGIKTPTNDPITNHYRKLPGAVPEWIKTLPWGKTVNIADYQGATDDERLEKARTALLSKGGGVLYFPAGTYSFKDNLDIPNGVILRGADPGAFKEATDEGYTLATRFEFPKYIPSFTGDGTPNSTAFKAITADASAANVGIVNIAINRGHVEFREAGDHNTASNRFVFGCILTNTAAADPGVPDIQSGNKPFQRWNARHQPAIQVYAGLNAYVANNRIPKSGDDNFTFPEYTLTRAMPGGTGSVKSNEIITLKNAVVFDYDNRPGIYVNGFSLPEGTPQTHPYAFRKGSLIRDNYIYCTGRSAIFFSGDGTICSYNVIRFPADVWRPTVTGRATTDGSSTNDNRGLTMRGYRWTAEGNDYIVHSNRSFTKGYINDGEGIMHERWANCTVIDSKIINNRGNRYLCLWSVDINGLLIQGNHVSDDGDPPIHVLGGKGGVHNLHIINNDVDCDINLRGIRVSAPEYSNIEIRGNRFVGKGTAKMSLQDTTWAKGNTGFVVETIQKK